MLALFDDAYKIVVLTCKFPVELGNQKYIVTTELHRHNLLQIQ
jgi:hypothetical protein